MNKSLIILSIFICSFLSNQNLFGQSKPIIVTTKRNDNNIVDINYSKSVPGTYYLEVRFPRLENCYPTTYKGAIKGNVGNLIRLRPINPERPISFSYSYTYTLGEPDPKVDNHIMYALPLQPGKEISVWEASNLKEKYFDEERPSNWKHYGYYSDNADTVYCMRKGIVVEIINQYVPNTEFNKTYTSNENRIVVEHPDGTYASYKGLKLNANFVNLGQTVYPHSKLGIMDQFNKDNYRLSFSIYYLTSESLNEKNDATTESRKSSYAYITPTFMTEQGAIKIDPKKSYSVIFNNDILLQEMTKREKKRFAKDPSEFQ